ncbi:unnamed protein product [Heterotrigona itama]|uniref:Uncharacterized protein n=1 Tax=Heterotrigona itama TaxID=395501 RepID=A0A6V7HCQ0_9HYME|nr:unnamed protein product [Heterotrigona itama]
MVREPVANLTSYGGMPRTLRIFCPKIAIFSCNITQNNFYHTDEVKRKATNYCIRFGHSLWSANQLPT